MTVVKSERSAGPAVSGEGFTPGCGGFAHIIVGKRRIKAANAALALENFLPLLLAAQQYMDARDQLADSDSSKNFEAMTRASDKLRSAIAKAKGAP